MLETEKVALVSAHELNQLQPLWNALYEHQSEHGMRLVVPSQGFELWAAPYRKLLGSFAAISSAQVNGQRVGFVAGKLRSLPPHFGASMVGFISDVFIDPKYRAHGLGKRLLNEVMLWFQSKGITRMELQVTSDNQAAREFYEHLGWQPELVQMVYEI